MKEYLKARREDSMEIEVRARECEDGRTLYTIVMGDVSVHERYETEMKPSEYYLFEKLFRRFRQLKKANFPLDTWAVRQQKKMLMRVCQRYSDLVEQVHQRAFKQPVKQPEPVVITEVDYCPLGEQQ